MNILFAASEAAPFVKSGGLGDVIGSLPPSLAGKNCSVSAVVPLYEKIPQQYKDKMTFISSIFVPVSWRNQYCGIFRLEENGVTWYFIDNEYYFKRGDMLYGGYDDAERFAFFSRAVLEILPHIDAKPDIIHCHDWQTALIPVYLKLLYSSNEYYNSIKTIFTIHNIEYQGTFGREIMENVLGISESEFDNGFMEHSGAVNFMKSAILCADKVTTVSKTYAEEIKTAEYAHGLDGILNLEKDKLSGIVNGIDKTIYDPETDKRLFANFSKDNLKGKAKNKRELQKMLNLPQKNDVPVIGIITRLVSHKGVDLISAVLDELLGDDIQIVVVGTGEWKYEQFLRDKQWQYPHRLSVNIVFNTDLAQKVYGAADMFLMPSKSEPCGLAQMIALSYGTIPIVRATGGLKDTIRPYSHRTGKGNGFLFTEYNAHEMLRTIRKACELYMNNEAWSDLVVQGMNCDFSWTASAKQYNKLYKALLK